MNSKLSEESPSSSHEDNNNANLNNGLNQTQNKGAIPKTKNYIQSKSKNVKVNNNIETLFPSQIEDRFKTTVVKSVTNSFIKNGVDYDENTSSNSLGEYETGTDLILSVSLKDINLDDDSSSSSDNELSISDDGCIYTYKGDDNVADLPSSFYNIEPPVLENINAQDEHREGTASPEMDFLEMDFDPGPSGDADSLSSTPSQEDEINNELPLDNETFEYEENIANIERNHLESVNDNEGIIESNSSEQNLKKPVQFEEIRMPWSCSQRTKGSKRLRIVRKHMNSYGDLTPNSDYQIINNEENDVVYDENEKVMIWNEQEAALKQITQIGPSSCGATAVLNVLTALRVPITSLDSIQECVRTNLRANSAPLPAYLKSRSSAGCTHREIITGLYKASKGKIYARFFAMYPEREFNLNKWLSFWIENGGVAVATLNLQKCEGSVIPDSWHHQMIFGVDSNNVYMTNPLERIDSGSLWHQLCSESVLLVRREDVLSRWNPKSDIVELCKIKDTRWTSLNVLGQVAKIVREQPRETRENSTVTSHIKIPADYKSGITIAVDKTSTLVYQLLRECPELPLLKSDSAIIINTT